MNFGQVLTKTLSAVQNEREEATRQLEHAATENLAAFMVCLAQELANEQQLVEVRIAAGIALKNKLTAREHARKVALQSQWSGLEATSKAQVKSAALQTLHSKEARASTAAAQVIAAIASIDLPQNQWPELIQTLLQHMADVNSTAGLKQATLQSIGFICEEIEPTLLVSQSDSILTAIMQGARKEEPSNAVRLAAINALLNSLEFIKQNFERENERNFIMQVVCECTKCTDETVVATAFEALVKIMSVYYEHMGVYMQQALFAMTIEGMRSEQENIALQAIEFWSTVCDEEITIAEDAAEAAEYDEQPDRQSLNFARAALPEITPVLLWLLTKQNEDDDDDEWNRAMAAGTCLSLLAQCACDEIVAPVVPFVEQNIQNTDWRFREASVMAFGSILEGPSSEVLQPLVSQALAVIINMTRDPVLQVKDTAAWTLGRIAELHPQCIQIETHLPNLINALLVGLEDSPRVAAHCAWAIMSLAESLGTEDPEAPSYPLSAFFPHIATALLRAADRSDGSEASLRLSAYEALSTLIFKSPRDCTPTVQSTALAVLERLEVTVARESQLVGLDEKNEHAELQTALCGAVQSFSRRLGKDIVELTDRIMTVFFQIFQSSNKTPTIVEDVFLAIGVVINSLDANFMRYTDTFIPYLYAALQNHEEHQLCTIAVGIVGDLCRALNDQVLPFCDQFMTLLLQTLQSTVAHRDVKPPILSCFGDVALAIQGKFASYLSVVMIVLEQACAMRAEEHDYDMQDYVNQLREGILEAYTGIVQGLKASNEAQQLAPFVEKIFVFLQALAMDPEKPEAVLRGGVGLIGDLADALGPQIKMLLASEWVDAMVKTARTSRSTSASTKEVAKWSRSVIKAAIAG